MKTTTTIRTRVNTRTRNLIHKLFCDHCKIRGHSVDKCWKIHGYPSSFKNSWKKNDVGTSMVNNISHDNIVQENNTEPRLTQEQYNQLMSLLSRQQTATEKEPTPSTTSFAGKTCLLSKSFSPWILDSGASDHICFDIALF